MTTELFACLFHGLCQGHTFNSLTSSGYSLKKSKEVQQYVDIYLLLNYSKCFGLPLHPSSGVHKTVSAASGTDHPIWGASFLKREEIRTGVGPTVPHQSLFGHV